MLSWKPRAALPGLAHPGLAQGHTENQETQSGLKQKSSESEYSENSGKLFQNIGSKSQQALETEPLGHKEHSKLLIDGSRNSKESQAPFTKHKFCEIKQGYHYLNQNPFMALNGSSPSGKSDHCTQKERGKAF